MPGFTGFPTATLEFLAGLREHNSKAWFDAHRTDYDEYYVGVAKEFVTAAGGALAGIVPAIRAEPRVNGSIFRVNRDIRFSKDKRPYKHHLDIWLWEGADRTAAVSGFYLRITPDAVGIGAGAHGFAGHRLAAYRSAVVAATSGPALLAAVAATARAGFPVKGEHYKKVPAGFQADGEPARLLRHAGLWTGEDLPVPASLHSGRFVGWCVTRWKKSLPLHRWLVDHVGPAQAG